MQSHEITSSIHLHDSACMGGAAQLSMYSHPLACVRGHQSKGEMCGGIQASRSQQESQPPAAVAVAAAVALVAVA